MSECIQQSANDQSSIKVNKTANNIKCFANHIRFTTATQRLDFKGTYQINHSDI